MARALACLDIGPAPVAADLPTPARMPALILRANPHHASTYRPTYPRTLTSDPTTALRVTLTCHGGQREETSRQETSQIVDARAAFGRVDVLITPADGRGEKWVDLSSITLADATTTNHR